MKGKIDYKLINITLLFAIFYLIYQTKDFWLGVLNVVWEISFPFLVAFTIAYAFYPLVRRLVNKKVPKSLAMIIVIGSITIILGGIICVTAPVLIDQITSLFNGIISFLREMSNHYNINFKTIQNTLNSGFNANLEKIGGYISNGAFSFIGVSIDYLSKAFIIFAAFIYFLADMDKIRSGVKNFLIKTNKRAFKYVQVLDDEMGKYLTGFVKIALISWVEYTIVYSIIGHPNAVMLGTLAALGNLIPYFGGIVANIIAAITAFVISPALFIKTCIVFAIFSGIDGYVINPLVYGKSNKIHPLVVIISVFAGGILAGILGIIISLPVSILLIATYKFFKGDIINIKNKRVKYHENPKN